MPEKQKIIQIKTLDNEKYENIPLDNLVMYAIGVLDEIKVDLSFENIAVAAYKLFPNKFSIQGYPEYPDIDRVKNCLNRLAVNKGMIGGKAKQGYFLNDRSGYYIEKAQKMLQGKISNDQPVKSQTRRKEHIIAEVMKTPAFVKYNENKGDSINYGDLCYMLQGTMDTPKEVIKSNFKSLTTMAEELNNRKLIKFLNFLSATFKNNIDL